MNPFSREPLKEFIDKRNVLENIPEYKKREDSVEDIVFSLIVSVFLIGVILFSGQPPTALVSYEANTEIIDINMLYNESINLSFVLEGIPTSLRITGSFIGNGSGLVFLDPFIAVEKDQLPTSGGMAITGFVVFENEINESIVENVTVEINETNITENITVNETIDINLTVNVTENLTIIPNISLNISENITEINITEINITQNITENVTVNDTITDVTIELEIREFEEYCLETCFLNDIPSEITLLIELDGLVLNLSHITYTYEAEEEIIVIPPIFENINNVTTNITEINVSVNETNLTINVTEINLTNVTIELNATNITLNITELNLTNITVELNETNFTQINVTNITIIEPLTEIEQFNLSLKNQGLLLLDYTQILDIYDLTLGLDENNLVKLSVNNLSKVNIDFFDLDDARLKSKVVRIANNITLAEISLFVDNIDVILQCTQFTNKTCKKWLKTNIPFVYENNKVNFTTNESGIYSVGELQLEKKEFIPTNTVYFNSDCYGCVEFGICNADNFCPGNAHGNRLFSFNAQFDFDIYDLDQNIESADVCAYTFSRYNEEATTNYLKNSELSYCSNIDDYYVSSNLISYGIIDQNTGWVCISVTEILLDNLQKGYSNMFIDWLGEYLDGEKGPYNCFRGIIALENCGGFNPSGATDCRSYLKINYK